MAKWWLLGTCLLTLSLSASPASFDCQQAFFETEKIICEYEELSRAEESVDRAYRERLSQLSRADKEQLREQQGAWSHHFLRRFDEQRLNERNRLKNALWILENLEGRTRILRQQLASGGVTLFTQAESERMACEAILARDNVHWLGRREGEEQWQVRVDSEHLFLRWASAVRNASVAPLDLFNDGQFSHVIVLPGLSAEGNDILLMVADAEYGPLREKLNAQKAGEKDYQRLFEQMGAFAVVPLGTATADVSGREGKMQSLRLSLDGANLFPHGRPIRIMPVQHDRQRYVLGHTNTASAGENVAVLLKPHSSGFLTPLCTHRAPRIQLQKVAQTLHPHASCAGMDREYKSLLGDHNRCSAAKMLHLPQWGGERCVMRMCDLGQNHSTAITRMLIGQLDMPCAKLSSGSAWQAPSKASQANNVHWQDLHNIDGIPHYAEAFNDLKDRDAWSGKIYYRLHEGRLTPGCFVGVKAVAPPGYGGH